MPSAFWIKPTLYSTLNIASATGIVFANKAVLSVYGFEFATALTLLHTLTTVLGMLLFCQLGVFVPKQIPTLQVTPLAASYVGYVVLNNLSLKLNTVGFYQISKICILPTLIAIEIALFGKYPSQKTLMAVALVCCGVALATATDQGLTTNFMGLLVGLSAVLVTAVYQVWVGSKQRELQTGSMQLLHQYTPLSALMLAVLVPMMEPIGLFDRSLNAHTLIGYTYSISSVTAIAISSVLGLLVSLSTFLVIGATSSLTYNIVGHFKTVTILAGGCLIFGDTMSVSKVSGVALAMVGIAWYSHVQFANLEHAQDKVVRPDIPEADSGHAQTAMR
ncbi:hypothetical protein ABBQ32_008815 [Trebouxia sp. C0010 RCD-2024]